MDKQKNKNTLSRRQVLGGTAAALGSVAATPYASAVESNPANLPPNVPEWTPYLGVGVDATPYGMPSEHESHVIRRNVAAHCQTSKPKAPFRTMTARLAISDQNIAKAVTILAAGQLVAFPTETVYGLGADATNNQAVAKIFSTKERPSFNPLIVHVYLSLIHI